MDYLRLTEHNNKTTESPDVSGIILNGKLYVLAGTYRQAREFATAYQCPKNRLQYIDDSYRLRGIDGRGKNLFVCWTAYSKDNYQECFSMAKERGFNIVHA